MRAHRAILRQLAEQGLDPRKTYTAGKEGKLISNDIVVVDSVPSTVRSAYVKEELKEHVVEVQLPKEELIVETESAVVIEETKEVAETVVNVVVTATSTSEEPVIVEHNETLASQEHLATVVEENHAEEKIDSSDKHVEDEPHADKKASGGGKFKKKLTVKE